MADFFFFFFYIYNPQRNFSFQTAWTVTHITLANQIYLLVFFSSPEQHTWGGGGGVLPYMGYIGMCRCEGYGFQAVYSSIGYINQSVWV